MNHIDWGTQLFSAGIALLISLVIGVILYGGKQ